MGPMRAWGVLILVSLALGCSDGKPKKKVNEPCADNTDCADAVCHGGVCASASPLQNGQKCGGRGECRSFACEGRVCVAGKATPGSGCLYNEECAGAWGCEANRCKGESAPDLGRAGEARPPDGPRPDAPKKPDGPLPDGAKKPDTRPPDAGPCKSGECFIEGKCYADQTVDPGDACRVCEVQMNAGFWTPVKGCVITLAGSGMGYAEGPALAAKLNTPRAVAVDLQGRVYVADYLNARTRLVEAGQVKTVLPNGGTAVEVDAALNVYGATSIAIFVRWGSAGTPTVVAGSNPGFADGAAASAKFSAIAGLALHKTTAELYVGDSQNHRVRAVYQGTVSTLAGSSTSGSVDGTLAAATFMSPRGVAVDSAGLVYVADYDGHRIRVVDKAGNKVSTLAGTGSAGFLDGAAASALFNSPAAVAVDDKGGVKVYVADTKSNRIRLVTGGQVSTVAGTPAAGLKDGQAATALFSQPQGVAVGPAGLIYVADTNNHRIRVIRP